MNWQVSNREIWGESGATCWDDLVADLTAALQATHNEGMVTGRTALYVEMWPDSGRFICYPAAHPVDGELAERDTDFSVQLAAAFWTAAWNCISSEAKNSSALYEQLTLRALTTLASAYDGCQPSVVTLYAFEYEGTEGVTVITNDVTNDDSRKD